MREPMRVRLTGVLGGVLCLMAGAVAGGEEPNEAGGDWYLQAGSYFHYSDDPDYAGTPWFLGLERFNRNGSVSGLAIFENSFGRFSQYLYIGKTWHPSDIYPGFRFKLTGGIVHGYEGEHQNTSPINWGEGWAVGIVPGVGFQAGRLGVDVAILSTSGLLFLVGYEF